MLFSYQYLCEEKQHRIFACDLFIVYQMGRLCGGAHEILGIKAPLFLHGGWLEGSWGVVGWW